MIFNIALTKFLLPLLLIFFSSIVTYFKLQLDLLEKNQVQLVEHLENIKICLTDNGKVMKEVLGSTKSTINVVSSSPNQFYMGVTSGDIVVCAINVVGFICLAYLLIVCVDQIGNQFATDLKIIDANASSGIDVMRSDLCSNTQQIISQVIEAAQLPNQVLLENLVAVRTSLLRLDPELKLSSSSCSEIQMTRIFTEYLTNGTPPPFL